MCVFVFPEELLKLPMLLFLQSPHTFTQQNKEMLIYNFDFIGWNSFLFLSVVLCGSGCERLGHSERNQIVSVTDKCKHQRHNGKELVVLKSKDSQHIDYVRDVLIYQYSYWIHNGKLCILFYPILDKITFELSSVSVSSFNLSIVFFFKKQ